MGRVAPMVEESTAFNSLYERRYNQFPQRNLLHRHLHIVATTESEYPNGPTNSTAYNRVSSTPNNSLVPSVAKAATKVKTVGTAAATVAMIPFFQFQ
mmetsp:Transcript_4929/g.5641  ORF Transcript_4929/g.5641 Transcript_4929/m.5641 type:complete len:97 (+) Transcript_4929:1513-1803(+)